MDARRTGPSEARRRRFDSAQLHQLAARRTADRRGNGGRAPAHGSAANRPERSEAPAVRFRSAPPTSRGNGYKFQVPSSKELPGTCNLERLVEAKLGDSVRSADEMVPCNPGHFLIRGDHDL